MSSEDSVNGSLPVCSSEDAVKYTVIAAFAAVAWYNVIELNIQVFLTFKRHRGLYFWSLIISSWGIALHVLGFILKFFVPASPWVLFSIIIMFGWWAMVTGQSVVLWSRLHLVVRDNKLLRAVLLMIVVDAICLHIPTSVLTWGSYSPNPAPFQSKFEKMEKVQLTVFVAQETIISSLYVWATLRLLRPIYHGRTRKVLIHLVTINIIIILMDAVVLGMEFSDHYEIQASLKPMVYSIKLKLEFAVLNQLMVLANTGLTDAARSQGTQGGNGRHGSSSTGGVGDGWDGSLSKEKSLNYQNSQPKDEDWDYKQTSRDISSGANANNKKKWIPSLDRNCIVKVSDFEVSHENKRDSLPQQGTTDANAGARALNPGHTSLMGTTTVGGPASNTSYIHSNNEGFNESDISPTESERELDPTGKNQAAHPGGLQRSGSSSSSELEWPRSNKKGGNTGQAKAQNLMGTTAITDSPPPPAKVRSRTTESREDTPDFGRIDANRTAPHGVPLSYDAPPSQMSESSSGGSSQTRVASASHSDSHSTSHGQKEANVSGAKKVRQAAHHTAEHMKHPLPRNEGGSQNRGRETSPGLDPSELNPYDNFVGAGVGAGSRYGNATVGAQPPGIPDSQNVYSRQRPIGLGSHGRQSIEDLSGEKEDWGEEPQLDAYGMRRGGRHDEERGHR
ncbi:MAG: hypothetical protein M1833_000500 [Piccolia ochrophora]|nr:MAG: hypothetical protein M1833_000500 [Piccolia ochrophora]